MKKLWNLLFLAGGVGWCLAMPTKVYADIQFRAGDILSVRNVTKGQTDFGNSIEVGTNDEVEFRVLVENIGTTASGHTNVRAGFALDPGKVLENRIFVSIWAAPTVTDTVELEAVDDSYLKLVYEQGKSVKYGGGCNGCSVSDEIAKPMGADIGDVNPGEKVEIRFRANLNNIQSSATTVSTTPVPTSTTSSNNASGSAVTNVAPKTGFTDPIWVRTGLWLTLGLAGFGLRQLARKLSTIEA